MKKMASILLVGLMIIGDRLGPDDTVEECSGFVGGKKEEEIKKG